MSSIVENTEALSSEAELGRIRDDERSGGRLRQYRHHTVAG